MKKIMAILIALSSSFVYASTFIYYGQGEWKDAAGNQGNHEVTMTVKQLENGALKIRTSVDAGAQDMTFVMRVEHGTTGICTIFNTSGVKIGDGYCFDQEVGKMCHYDIVPQEGVNIEESFYMSVDIMKRMGSKYSVNGRDVMWRDELRRINPAIQAAPVQ